MIRYLLLLFTACCIKITAFAFEQNPSQFMENNSLQDGIVDVVELKLQYKVEKEGFGELIDEKDAPLLCYSLHLQDGTLIVESDESVFSLNSVIPGFRQGIIGMKEGEKRTIYIHPDLGYGASTTPPIPPNSLLIFEVEVIKKQIQKRWFFF